MLSPEAFQWDDFCWTTRIELPEWRGFLGQGQQQGQLGTPQRSDGTVDLVFAPEGRGGRAPLTDEELILVQWFLEHHTAVSDAALVAIGEAYPSLRELLNREDDIPPRAPVLSDPGELQSLIGLHAVNVHNVVNGGEPYLGLELVCRWDDEHGLGLMMHGKRVVVLGGADTAILVWIARRDAGSR